MPRVVRPGVEEDAVVQPGDTIERGRDVRLDDAEDPRARKPVPEGAQATSRLRGDRLSYAEMLQGSPRRRLGCQLSTAAGYCLTRAAKAREAFATRNGPLLRGP